MKLCEKFCYSLKEAKTALNECKKYRSKQYRKECRYYLCEESHHQGLYHLTSDTEYEKREYLKEEDLIFCEMWKKLKGE